MLRPPRTRVVFAIAISLACGSLLYLVRRGEPRAFDWLPASLARGLSETRAEFAGAVHLPRWLLGSGSDAAYGFALGAWLARASAPVVVLGAGVVLAHELAQGLGLAAGTFDVKDLVALIASYALGVVVLRSSPPSLVSAERSSS